MNVFIRKYNDTWHWYITSEDALIPESRQGSLHDLVDYCRSHEQIRNWVLVAPALDTACRTISFSAKEKKHIAKALPFMLEEALLTEADDLYYVADKPQAESIDVVALDEAVLAAWLEELEQAGVTVSHCLPEMKLVADAEADWLLFYHHGEFIVKTQGGDNFAFEAEHLALSLDLLSENFSNLPAAIQLVADNEEALEQALSCVPESLHHLLQQYTLNYATALQQGFSANERLWNLLQGKFARSQQWLVKIMPWRWVLVALVAVFSLQLTMMAVQTQQLKKTYEEQRQQMDALFRQAIPRGKIVDHRKQLGRELRKLDAGGSNAGFVTVMNKAGTVLAKHKVQNLNSLNYNAEKSEMRLDLLIADYDALQAILSDLKAAGLTAEIQNSNAQGEQLRARLRIGG